MSSRFDVKDLSVGSIDQTFLLSGAVIAETKNGKPFLRVNLVDMTGEIPGVQWDCETAPAPGVYRVRGFIEEYQGTLQCKIGSVEASGEDVGGFVRRSESSHEALHYRLAGIEMSLQGAYGEIVVMIFSDEALREKFLTSPAATGNHHAYVGGLAEHTFSMFTLAHDIGTHYNALYGKGTVDLDLLLAGTLLHDLGKVVELQQNDGFSHSYSVGGELVGHIAECVTIVHDACMATLASDEVRSRLLHMILSHHGQLEWGSPVKPKLLEAQILHLVDMIDSRTAMFREATAGLQENQISEWVRPLGGRVVR